MVDAHRPTRDADRGAGGRQAPPRQLTLAGLWRASAHKLRHTFGTRLAEAGVDLLVIKDLLGNVTAATTQIYAYVAQRRLREAIERIP